MKKRVVEAYTNGKAPNFHQSDVSFSTIFKGHSMNQILAYTDLKDHAIFQM